MMSRILRFGLFASMLGFAACDENPLTRNALLELTVNMPTQSEGEFIGLTGSVVKPRFGMIVVSAGAPERPAWAGDPRSYQFSENDGEFGIPLSDGTANPRKVSILAEDGFERPIWVLVRVCLEQVDCSGASPMGNARDHIWIVERGLYKAQETRLTLPITDSTDSPAQPSPYGCVRDEWAARATDIATNPGNEITLSPCFVFGCAQMSGDSTWGCPGAMLGNTCEFESASPPVHSCEIGD